jgi:AcrR family transcriptional regulator
VTAKRRLSGQHHGDLRNALEEAALTLVAERGPHGFTLAEACRRAGVRVSAPYKYFADRGALLASLAGKGYREQHRRYSAAISTSEDPADESSGYPKVVKSVEQSHDVSAQRRLWTISENLTGVSYPV